MPKRKPEMHAVLSDAHFPHHDPTVIDLAVEFCRDHQPKTIHLLGDLVDFYAISSFDKDPGRVLGLQDELDQCVEWMDRLRAVCPKSRILYYEGNHEHRLTRYLWRNAKELSSLRAVQIERLLELKKLKAEWKHRYARHKHGKLLFTHGSKVRTHSAYTARAHTEQYGCSVIHGHTHRLGTYFRTTFSGTIAGWENGCLCDTDPEYVESPNWQQGWSVVWYYGDLFHVEQVVVVDGQYVYHGELKRKKGA